jgi:hypothetical protein
MHIVQYTVKPDQADENERLVRAVFAELQRLKPPGLRYATLRAKGGLAFMHLVAYDVEGATKMTDFPAFKAFSEGVRNRCDVPPDRTEWEQLGAYGVAFDA